MLIVEYKSSKTFGRVYGNINYKQIFHAYRVHEIKRKSFLNDKNLFYFLIFIYVHSECVCVCVYDNIRET